MHFKDESTLIAFLNDKPFYENNDCFCLGDTLAEAGCIVDKIVKANELYRQPTTADNTDVAAVAGRLQSSAKAAHDAML